MSAPTPSDLAGKAKSSPVVDPQPSGGPRGDDIVDSALSKLSEQCAKFVNAETAPPTSGGDAGADTSDAGLHDQGRANDITDHPGEPPARTDRDAAPVLEAAREFHAVINNRLDEVTG